jgi:hypothetical protein
MMPHVFILAGPQAKVRHSFVLPELTETEGSMPLEPIHLTPKTSAGFACANKKRAEAETPAPSLPNLDSIEGFR